MTKTPAKSRESDIPAIRVHQWLDAWDSVKWAAEEHRAKPRPSLYQFTISASMLKALSGVQRRSTAGRKSSSTDLGIQRRHEVDRSREIAEFIQYGYPWSGLSNAKRDSGEYEALKKPGWLPTSIVINVLTANDRRRGIGVGTSDLVEIHDESDRMARIVLPKGVYSKGWQYESIAPIEVIDGQHRLWAFEDTEINGRFELPVVAFVGLDISWQAYLFYTINIKPKKINTSLAFDLYPLLRTEDWLDRFEGHLIYREARAQEIVDALWGQESSPWHHRINMLGEPGMRGKMVSQAAWIRSLLATFIKSFEGRGVRIGGLYGAPVGSHYEALPWTRAEQCAFLIFLGHSLRMAVARCKLPWAGSLRAESQTLLQDSDDAAFYGANSLLNQDQGIRAFLAASNDLFFVMSDQLSLAEWGGSSDSDQEFDERVNESLASLKERKHIVKFASEFAESLSTFDWRASSASGLDEQEALLKSAFRGSGGYKELRKHVLRHLSGSESLRVAGAAKEVLAALGY